MRSWPPGREKTTLQQSIYRHDIEHAAGTGTSTSARLAAELRKLAGEDIAHIAIKATVVTLRRGISTLSLLNLANRRPPRLVLWAGSLLFRRHRPPLSLNVRAI